MHNDRQCRAMSMLKPMKILASAFSLDFCLLCSLYNYFCRPLVVSEYIRQFAIATSLNDDYDKFKTRRETLSVTEYLIQMVPH